MDKLSSNEFLITGNYESISYPCTTTKISDYQPNEGAFKQCGDSAYIKKSQANRSFTAVPIGGSPNIIV